LKVFQTGWRGFAQLLGSVFVAISPVFSVLAFLYEPDRGMAGHSWRTPAALLPLFAGVMLHLVSQVGKKDRAAPN
jgi:hypothetical protein